MTNNESRKKLIEHSLPLDAINEASSREKSIRHGHPSTLHLWWARRPLAACRAVLFAQLVDDPSSWPDRFPTLESQDRERRRLHKVISDMVEWPRGDAADHRRYELAIEAARWEIARTVAWELGEEPPQKEDSAAILVYLQNKAPPVYDPFCGGGSIPLEAQRLGLRAYGSDLNPVAVLITKSLIEFPPKFAGLDPVHPEARKEIRTWTGAQGLAEDVRRYGQWMRDEAEKAIGHLYPKAKLRNGQDATVIAWLWARTVQSPDPAQKGARVPLASSFVLSSREGGEAIVVPVKDPAAKDGWRFDVKTSSVTAEEFEAAKKGTKSEGANFSCLLSGTSISSAYIRAEGQAGRLGSRLMAVVVKIDGSRDYLPPTNQLEHVPSIVAPDWQPDTEFFQRALGFRIGNYGFKKWSDLFTPRQIVLLSKYSSLISDARKKVLDDAEECASLKARTSKVGLAHGGIGSAAYADAIATYLALGVSRLADIQNSLCAWERS